MGQPTNADPWTIRRVVQWIASDFRAREIASPRLDADLLVAEVLGLSRVELFLDLDRPLGKAELSTIRRLVARRRNHEPIAYILGRKEFYGHVFEVNSSVLVPRPDTETLVERALAWIDARGKEAVRAVDLGTGSGAIGISILLERESVSMDAVDVSTEALEVAVGNAARLGCGERFSPYAGDLFEPLPPGEYDLIVSNPPYIKRGAELPADVVEHEPSIALFADEDGLSVVQRVLDGATSRLAAEGVLLMEIGFDQAEAVQARVEATRGLLWVGGHQDLGGHVRVVEVSRS